MPNGSALVIPPFGATMEPVNMFALMRAGRYKITLNDDNLILNLIDDPCEDRANSINGLKWVRASK